VTALARVRARLVASARRDIDRWLLGAAALALLGSFLNPRLEFERALFEHVIVLDVTQSMNVQDEFIDGRPVSRLAYSKHLLRQALKDLPCGSKVGWAVFTEYRSFLLMAPVEVCGGLVELLSTLARIDGQMAWSGNSEVAKGLHSGLVIAKQLPNKPSLIFVTDGHEAPPLSPRHRPSFDDKPGEVAGLIVGVGSFSPSPIPKTDPLGRPLGFWRADEVAQSDLYSTGRGTSVPTEKFVDDEAAVAALPGASPGSEHLSSLREGYLRLLSGEQGLGYERLQGAPRLQAALTAPALSRPVRAQADLRPLLAALALGLLLARHLLPFVRQLPSLWQRADASGQGQWRSRWRESGLERPLPRRDP
jgi:mxaL protein